MHIQIEEAEIVIIVNIADLRQMEQYDQKFWGIPNQAQTKIIECYMDSEPESDFDIVVAHLVDFLKTQCSNPLDCHPDDDNPYDTITLRIPREIRNLRQSRRPGLLDWLLG